MHYQDDNSLPGDWLFGSTRSTEEGKVKNFIIVWMLPLDATTKQPINGSTDLKMFRLDEGKFQDRGHITGIRDKMNGSLM